MSELIGYYETKCRRCGKFHEWELHVIAGYSHLDFKETLDIQFGNSQSSIRVPDMHSCNKCKKETIQDLVSYEEIKAEL